VSTSQIRKCCIDQGENGDTKVSDNFVALRQIIMGKHYGLYYVSESHSITEVQSSGWAYIQSGRGPETRTRLGSSLRM